MGVISMLLNSIMWVVLGFVALLIRQIRREVSELNAKTTARVTEDMTLWPDEDEESVGRIHS